MRALALCSVLAALAAAAGPAAALDVFAHRGGPIVDGQETFAENSLPAFRAAAREGTALELDVRMSLDGVPLVIHDATFDRTTSCSGAVAMYDSGFVRRNCRGVPTLSSVMRVAARHGVHAMVEIKYDEDAPRVIDAVRDSPIPRRLVILQSFSPRALALAARTWPGVATALLSNYANHDAARFYAARRFDWVAPRWPVDRAYVEAARDQGLRVMPFSVRSPAAVRRAAAVGADALITDDPTTARRVLRGGR